MERSHPLSTLYIRKDDGGATYAKTEKDKSFESSFEEEKCQTLLEEIQGRKKVANLTQIGNSVMRAGDSARKPLSFHSCFVVSLS